MDDVHGLAMTNRWSCRMPAALRSDHLRRKAVPAAVQLTLRMAAGARRHARTVVVVVGGLASLGVGAELGGAGASVAVSVPAVHVLRSAVPPAGVHRSIATVPSHVESPAAGPMPGPDTTAQEQPPASLVVSSTAAAALPGAGQVPVPLQPGAPATGTHPAVPSATAGTGASTTGAAGSGTSGTGAPTATSGSGSGPGTSGGGAPTATSGSGSGTSGTGTSGTGTSGTGTSGSGTSGTGTSGTGTSTATSGSGTGTSGGGLGGALGGLLGGL